MNKVFLTCATVFQFGKYLYSCISPFDNFSSILFPFAIGLKPHTKALREAIKNKKQINYGFLP